LGERRVGHTGTLDPMAEGLLLLCVGRATRLQQYLLGWDKTYHGTVRLGRATTTYDAEGEPTEPSGTPPALDRQQLEALERQFTGLIEQVPPQYSAKKVAGKRLYELARSGENVQVGAKQVHVAELSLELVAPDLMRLCVRSASGFYVRTLAHDIGMQLGCGAHLESLQRVSIGPYTLDQALSQQGLSAAVAPEEIIQSSSWIPVSSIALPFPQVELNLSAVEKFQNGQEVVLLRSAGEPVSVDTLVSVVSQQQQLIGIGRVQNVLARGRTLNIRPAMVLETSSRGARSKT